MSDPRLALQSLWDFDDPAGSEHRFLALLERDLEVAFRVEVLTQVARAQGLQSRFDEAGRTIDEAALLEADDRGRIRIALERGRVLRSAGDATAAVPLFDEAWERAVETGEDGLAVDAAHMIAIVSDPARAVEWNERALRLAETSRDPDARRWAGSLANNLGWAYHDRDEPETALAWFERALAARRAEGDVHRERIARWTVARCLRTLGRVEAALAIQQGLAAELDAAGATDGFVLEEIGECLLALRRDDEARPWHALAYLELSRDRALRAHEPERLERLRSLGSP